MKNTLLTLLVALIAFGFGLSTSQAEDAAEMAKKMQDSLANIKAIQNEFNYSFNAGDKEEDALYGWQSQPVGQGDGELIAYEFRWRVSLGVSGLLQETPRPRPGPGETHGPHDSREEADQGIDQTQEGRLP